MLLRALIFWVDKTNQSWLRIAWVLANKYCKQKRECVSTSSCLRKIDDIWDLEVVLRKTPMILTSLAWIKSSFLLLTSIVRVYMMSASVCFDFTLDIIHVLLSRCFWSLRSFWFLGWSGWPHRCRQSRRFASVRRNEPDHRACDETWRYKGAR